MIDIFTYTDYRRFLEDFCADARKTKPFYSYRYLGAKVGLKSPSFLSWVIKGRRNITHARALRLAATMKLKKREADFFVLLVNHNQASQTEERQHYLEKLLGFRGVRARIVDRDAEKYYTRWYYPAIRELVAIMPVRSGPDIAGALCPPIKKSDAGKALDFLERLGMIRKSATGVYERVDPALCAGPSVDPAVIHGYQIATMQLGEGALHRFPRDNRDISTVTFSCNRVSFERIRERVAQMRAEITGIACDSRNAEQVYQVNVQVFPLSSPCTGSAP